MTTENEQVGQEVQEKQYTEIEQKALEMGWRPKEEFEGLDEDFVDAKEFVQRKPLYDKISQQSKQIKNVYKALDALKDHYTKVKEVEFQSALKALKAQRREAFVQGDIDAVEKAENQIQEAEKQFTEIKASAESIQVNDEPVLNPVFINWKNRNSWYDTTGYMREYADDVGRRLHASGLPPDEVLKEVEKAVRKEFPQKFTNPNKGNAPEVSSPRGGQGKGVEYQLTDQERNIMNTLVKTGVMTKEQYISDLKKAKGA